jgi:PD-(D/E)XK nuclease family transposase
VRASREGGTGVRLFNPIRTMLHISDVRKQYKAPPQLLRFLAMTKRPKSLENVCFSRLLYITLRQNIMVMKFVDIKNDIAFRKIFGNDKKTEILISFLNAVMHLEGDKRIKSITIANPFQLPILPNMKTSIIDVKARDFRGNTFIVEMQVADVLSMDKWIYFIKEAENLDVIPNDLNDNGLKEAYKDANQNAWSQAELDAYNYSGMREQDDRGRIAKAELKALQKGVEQKEVEATIGLDKIDLPKEKIAEALNISIERVTEIIENHKNKA